MTDRREFIRIAAVGAGGIGLALLRPGPAAGGGVPSGAAAGPPARRAEPGTASGKAEPPPPPPMRILILGGTRFIGPHQVKYAIDRGHEVSIFNRGRTEPPFFHDYFERVEHLQGDRSDDLGALESGEWDAVIDNSASVPRWVRESAGLLKGRAGRYLFVSSVSAYRDFAVAGMEEDYPLAQLDDPTVEEVTGATYGGMKALCEHEAREAFGESAIIVRPGLIIGPGDNSDRWTYWPVRIDRGGEVAAPGTPDDPTQQIDARDLSEWIVRMAESGDGGSYNATGPAWRRGMGEMLETVRDGLRADASFTWIDAGFLAEQGIQPWGEMTNWLPPAGDSLGIMQVSVARAVAQGLTFRPLETTARDTLAWWKSLPEVRRAEPRAGLAAAKERELLAAWQARRSG